MRFPHTHTHLHSQLIHTTVNKTSFPRDEWKFHCYTFWKPHFQKLYKGKYSPMISIKGALISEGVLRFTTSTMILWLLSQGMGSHAHHLLLVHSASVHVTGMNHVLPYLHVPYQIDHLGPVTEKNKTVKLVQKKCRSTYLCSILPHLMHITVTSSHYSIGNIRNGKQTIAMKDDTNCLHVLLLSGNNLH